MSDNDIVIKKYLNEKWTKLANYAVNNIILYMKKLFRTEQVSAETVVL